MRKGIMILLAVALLAGTAYGALGDLIASFPNVGTATYHYGLAADANYLYSYYYYSTWRYPVIQMRRANGAYVSSYTAPGPSYYYNTRGLDCDGVGYIYGCVYSYRYVTHFRATTGSLLSTWMWPTTMGYRYGICIDHKGTSAGTYIYQSYYNGDFFKSTTFGSLVSTWSLPYYTYNMDQTWDWNNQVIWASNYNNCWVYGIDPKTQQIVHSFRHPKAATISSTYGIAYYPPYLYVSNSGGTPDEYIWVLSCPNNVGLTPASVGKIKTLFK